MNIMNAYQTNLQKHYGADKLLLIDMKHRGLALIGGLTLSIFFILLDRNPLERWSSIGSFLAMSAAIWALVKGYSRLSTAIAIIWTYIIILFSILLSGGFPYSIMSGMIVIIPMLSFLVWNSKAGWFSVVCCFILASGLYSYNSQLTEIFPDISLPNKSSNNFIGWLTTSFLILLIVVCFERKTQQLNDLLDSERTKMEKLATTDYLTQLYNARGFNEKIDHLIKQANIRKETIFHLFYIDLNAFKPINDTYGHEAGDHVLKSVASRLNSCIDGRGFSGRLGGDEFAIILKGKRTTEEISDIITDIRKSVAKPIIWEEHQFDITNSLGYACFPDDCKTRKGLVRHADLLMYDDKENSKGPDLRLAS